MTTIFPLIALIDTPIDRAATIDAITYAGAGAIVTFDGIVRDNADGKSVQYLEYEAYPEMALEQMHLIVQQVRKRWDVDHIALIHRLGHMEIGETSILIVVASPHRAEAFEACRYIIDTVKNTVPIWKKEFYTDGSVWVE